MLSEIRFGIDGFFTLTDFKMQLRRDNAAGCTDRRNFFTTGDPLAFFNQNLFIMRIGRNPAVIMFYQNQIAKAFKLVAGIGDGSFIRGLDCRSFGSFDIYTVIVAPFGYRPEVRNYRTSDRPHKFAFAIFSRRRIGAFGGCLFFDVGGVFRAGSTRVLGFPCAFGRCGRSDMNFSVDDTVRQLQALSDGKTVRRADIIGFAQGIDVNIVAFGDIVQRIALGYDMIARTRKADDLSYPQPVGRTKTVQLDNFPARKIIPAGNAVKQIALLNSPRTRGPSAAPAGCS